MTQGRHSGLPPDEPDADFPEEVAAMFPPVEHANKRAAGTATRTARRYFMSRMNLGTSVDYMQPPT